ncbi:putative glycosyl transferase [Leptolyngbya sp. NIES-3755]|nr:putative glycosyl transferase [Leptolyngbya sp. NIES-3755]
MDSFVSICVPTYNGEQYIRECLDSILAQSFTNFEVLIVDDQSSDQTMSISLEYARRDQRIKVIQNESNLGLVGNWNRCVQLARGEWIKFVFQDDLILPNCLEKLLEATKLGIPIVFCRREFIFEHGISEELKGYYRDLQLPEKFLPNASKITSEEFCQSVLDNLWVNFIGEPTSMLLHRSVFQQFGAFNPNLIQLCDLEYWTRIASSTGIAYVPEYLAAFRVHQKSTSQLNHSENDFRRSLDPLVMLHMFSYHHYYENLRLTATHSKNPIDFKKRFLRVAYVEANRTKFMRRGLSDSEANKVTKVWNDLVDLLPELNLKKTETLKQKFITKKIQVRRRFHQSDIVKDRCYSSYL